MIWCWINVFLLRIITAGIWQINTQLSIIRESSCCSIVLVNITKRNIFYIATGCLMMTEKKLKLHIQYSGQNKTHELGLVDFPPLQWDIWTSDFQKKLDNFLTLKGLEIFLLELYVGVSFKNREMIWLGLAQGVPRAIPHELGGDQRAYCIATFYLYPSTTWVG